MIRLQLGKSDEFVYISKAGKEYLHYTDKRLKTFKAI